MMQNKQQKAAAATAQHREDRMVNLRALSAAHGGMMKLFDKMDSIDMSNEELGMLFYFALFAHCQQMLSAAQEARMMELFDKIDFDKIDIEPALLM